MIQASIWPMALYSADAAFLGMTHFQALRAAALFAFIGKCNFASPWLACFSLSKHLLDPLLFVILSILRSIRRLMTICTEEAMSIVRLACRFEGTRPFGPGSLLRDICPSLAGRSMTMRLLLVLNTSLSVWRATESVKFLNRPGPTS